MHKVLFLGYAVNPEEANSMSGASVAGNKMQWNILKNLCQYEDISLNAITITPIAAFPHDKCLWQKKESIQLECGTHTMRVPYLNFPIFKQFWQILSVYFCAKKEIQKNGADTLFCFNLFPQVGVPMRWLKNKFPELDTVCLLADLPIDDNKDRKGISKWLRKRFENSTWKSMEICDRFITLNDYVAEKFLPGKPYVVVEGGVDEEQLKNLPEHAVHKAEKNILFCGALTEYNGIMNLITAVNMLDHKEIFLDIYGSGYLEKQVAEAANRNPRIRYHGRVSNEIVMQKQREAWLLANPREVDNLISKVTFPSKTFEYLLSGTPVLTTPLSTYGSDYTPYFFLSEGDKAIDLNNLLFKILVLPDQKLTEKAADAATFIRNQKLWGIQCNKIKRFLVLESGLETAHENKV